MKRNLAILLVLVAVPIIGCGDEEEPPASPPRDTPTSTTLPDPVPGDDLEPPDFPANEDPTAVVCDPERPQELFDATSLVGMRLPEAEARAEAAGCSVRVVVEDGEPLAVTQDFSPFRINVAIRTGTVVEIDGLY